MAVVIDSDAVIGFLDEGDALHQGARSHLTKLLRAGEPVLASVITFAEVLTGAKRGHHGEGEARGFFDRLVSELLPVELETAERAAELRGAHPRLLMPDALILASADLHPEVGVVIGGDRRALRVPGLSCRIELLSGG